MTDSPASTSPGRPRELLLHVGASKTGTSALQAGLTASVDGLAAQGVGLPLPDRRANVRRLLRPLGWETARGFVHDVDPDGLERLTRRLRSAPGERLVVSCEDLCEADEPRVRALVRCVEDAGLRPTVVLSLRSLASVVPSEWQQFLKHRVTLDYPTFLARVRDHEGPEASHFWRRQDAPTILRRWADVIGADRVRVLVVSARGGDPDALYRAFGQLAGFDPAPIDWPAADVNPSWGYVEAEVYRRVGVALGNRLRDYEREYHPAVRGPLTKGVLPRGASARITLPPEHLDWVREEALRTRDAVRAAGYRVDGDLDALVPADDDARALPPLEEAAVAQAAITTLANLCTYSFRRRTRAERDAADAGPSGNAGPTRTPPPSQEPTPVPAPARLRRVAGAVRRRARAALPRPSRGR
ncbi:hypothetical protein GCM10009737_28690 [Nocardioides lentus]|uniref:Sulfotransferase family protein n=1 Tax=Nocardioides lentus TaxID=338077 RepID=A0ABP5AZP9_9ACTN